MAKEAKQLCVCGSNVVCVCRLCRIVPNAAKHGVCCAIPAHKWTNNTRQLKTVCCCARNRTILPLFKATGVPDGAMLAMSAVHQCCEEDVVSPTSQLSFRNLASTCVLAESAVSSSGNMLNVELLPRLCTPRSSLAIKRSSSAAACKSGLNPGTQALATAVLRAVW